MTENLSIICPGFQIILLTHFCKSFFLFWVFQPELYLTWHGSTDVSMLRTCFPKPTKYSSVCEYGKARTSIRIHKSMHSTSVCWYRRTGNHTQVCGWPRCVRKHVGDRGVYASVMEMGPTMQHACLLSVLSFSLICGVPVLFHLLF